MREPELYNMRPKRFEPSPLSHFTSVYTCVYLCIYVCTWICSTDLDSVWLTSKVLVATRFYKSLLVLRPGFHLLHILKHNKQKLIVVPFYKV